MNEKCTHCGSVNTRTKEKRVNRYYCKDCKRTFTVNGQPQQKPPKRHKVGMSLEQFRAQYDVDFIVNRTLEKLDKDTIYEKNDIVTLSGLRPGYPGLVSTIENRKEYYGKVGSTMYFSHPDTIKDLKEQAKLH